MIPIRRAAFTCVWLLWIVPVVSAQPTPLTPPAVVRSIEPDRPDLTNSAQVVGAGLWQLEVGGIYTRPDAAHRSLGTPVTARVGVFDWLEARVGSDGLLSQSDEIGRATGVGNLQVGAKVRLWADPDGLSRLSILPGITVPTASASKGLGSGDPDYTIAVLTGADVGERGHVDVNYGIGAIGAGSGRSSFVQHLVSISGSVAATSRWNPYLEVFWFSRQNI